MLIQVRRFVSDNDTTLSIVSVDDVFQCFGCEDEQRAFKIPGETRIAANIYPVRLRTEGGFHARYLRKFPDFHQGMLEICDVVNFDYVLIHIGNTDDDTGGCLLVGSGANTIGELSIQSSRVAYKNFYRRVIQAALDEELYIEFIDDDHKEAA